MALRLWLAPQSFRLCRLWAHCVLHGFTFVLAWLVFFLDSLSCCATCESLLQWLEGSSFKAGAFSIRCLYFWYDTNVSALNISRSWYRSDISTRWMMQTFITVFLVFSVRKSWIKQCYKQRILVSNSIMGFTLQRLLSWSGNCSHLVLQSRSAGAEQAAFYRIIYNGDIRWSPIKSHILFWYRTDIW